MNISEKPRKINVVDGLLPVSPIQHLFWLSASQESTMNHGRLNVRFVVQGPLSTEVINIAWLETVKHHPALRASIKANKQDNPILIIRNEEGITNHSPICCPTTPSRNEISLSDSPSSVLYVNQNHEKNTKFDWYCHHAFLDGWSAQIIVSDLSLIHI